MTPPDINKKNFTLEALLSLCPGAEFVLFDEDYSRIQWTKIPEGVRTPSVKELQTEIERLKQEHERNKYQRLREKEYPSIKDQLDTLYHEGYEGWKAKIDEIKMKYPKPPKIS